MQNLTIKDFALIRDGATNKEILDRVIVRLKGEIRHEANQYRRAYKRSRRNSKGG